MTMVWKIKTRKPVSRVDSKNTHGWFARVYRAEWVGNRSFADRKYGSKDIAQVVAYEWVRIANDSLPVIPPKPVLRKATLHIRFEEQLQSKLWYVEVYIPPLNGETTWTEKLYFHNLLEKEKQKAKATNRLLEYNMLAEQRHKVDLALWYVEHDKMMAIILELWPNLKNMKM